MASRAAEGAKAMNARDYPLAIDLYTQALESSHSPIWLTQRSTAYLRTRKFPEALQDAESAVLEAISRGRRELIGSAQMRRAVALHAMGLLGDARLCFTWVRKLNEKEPGIGMWQEKVKHDYNKLPDGAVGTRISLKEVPDKAATTAIIESWVARSAADSIGSPPTASPVLTAELGSSSISSKSLAGSPPLAPKAETLPAEIQTARDKIRQEWFQSSSKITITIFAKNVPKDKIDIHYDSSSLSISFPTGTPGVDFDFTASPLFSNIVISESSHLITLNKVEVTLRKEKTGLKWPKLESDVVESQAIIAEPSAGLSNTANLTSRMAPTYPTSSRTGPKNWDALAKQALKEAKTKDVAQEDDKDSPQGEENERTAADDDSDDEGDALNGFFKKLYKGADPETRRAMMKSYVESNGTALSTNWDEVSKKEVPTEPPAGLQANKW